MILLETQVMAQHASHGLLCISITLPTASFSELSNQLRPGVVNSSCHTCHILLLLISC